MIKILVVDDEEGIRSMLRMSLESDGYAVVTAADGREALGVIRNDAPDVTLLDVRMPGMDGLQVLERIKGRLPDAEVIIMTGHGDMEMAVECLRKDASDFLAKPISDELLSFALKRSIERLALKSKLRQYTHNLETLVREANIELERQYKFRENLIEHSPDAIICIRKGGEIIIFNSAAERLLGYGKEDVVSKMNIVNLYPPGEAKRVMKDLRSDDFGGPGILKKRDLLVLDYMGNEIPVYISAAILYEDGKEAGSVGVFTDIREKKEMERRLLRTEKLSSLGKLSAGIAHEISRPLAEALKFASLLMEKFKDDEATRKDLEIVVKETGRIHHIVQGVLDFAREMPLSKGPARIEDLIDRTLEIIIHQKRFFGIRLNKIYDPSTPLVVVDEGLMEQVFLNIILNAFEAMQGMGTLEIRSRREGARLEVDVTDSGPGMPESMIDKIFDPFFTTKKSSEGTGMGLGLAVSYGIVKNHEGDIKVVSRPGEGSTFTVLLPIGADEPPAG
ncbi:MAG: response regulator [Pseudomonadota bacterium]